MMNRNSSPWGVARPMFNFNSQPPPPPLSQRVDELSQDSGYNSQHTQAVSVISATNTSLKDEIVAEVQVRTESIKTSLVEHVDNQLHQMINTMKEKIESECGALTLAVQSNSVKMKKGFRKTRKRQKQIEFDIIEQLNHQSTKLKKIVKKEMNKNRDITYRRCIKTIENVIRRESTLLDIDCGSTQLDFETLKTRLYQLSQME